MSILQTRAALDATVLIDAVRHENMAIQSFLNVDAQRAELAEQLTEYYKRQGVVDVTPEMIEAGVALLERDRFTYKGFSGGPLAKAVAGAYLKVNHNSKAIGLMLLLGVVCGGMLTIVNSRLEAGRYSGLVQDIGEYREKNSTNAAKVKRFIDDQNAWLDSVKKNPEPTWALDVTQVTLSKFRSQLEVAGGKLYSMVTLIDGGEDKPSVEAVKKDYERYSKQLDDLSVRINPIADSLQKDVQELLANRQSLEALWSADRALSDLMSTKAYQEYAADPQVELRQSAVRAALVSGLSSDATKAMEDLKVTLAQRSKSKALINGLAAVTAEYSSVFKDAEGQRKYNLLTTQGRKAAEQGNEADYRKATSDIRALAQYVAMDLTVRVVDGKGKKSGTGDRCKLDSSGRCIDGPRRYYVILEAVDASGRAVPREVYNQEKRINEVVSSWGQEVTSAVYDNLRKEKQSNGFVVNRDYGSKAPGNYSLTFDRSVLKGTITSWVNE